ncbi:AarF/ABC1/UbiB kinase family protein [Methanobrevibacter sp. TMH8]|nr:AarF/ABC1/UbiB kinase family protein [Methanobrevibacter sp. TMH8]
MNIIRRKNNSNLKRLNEILKVLSKYEFDYIIERIGLKHKIPIIRHSHNYESMEELDSSLPIRLRKTLQELGPAYIKLGQMISTRPDLVGEDIALEFSKMQYDNPLVSFAEIRRTVERELGSSIEDIFEIFYEIPLSSASIGQVHVAKLIDGPYVAVKIQKPNIEEIIKTDLSIMKFLAKRIDQYIPQAKTYNFPIIVKEFERSILKEIDYFQEFNNLKRFSIIFENDPTVYVPKAYGDFSTKKVLTMELIQGEKISDVVLSEGIYDKKLIAKRGIESYFKQVVDHGFFHADPHPSNIYILEDNVVCYIDFGMMGVLDSEFRENLTELFIYLIERNVKGMVSQLGYMGVLKDNIDRRALQYDFMDLVNKYYGMELKGVHGGMMDMISIMRTYDVILPREFVLISKGLSMLEETGIELDPNFNTIAVLEPQARRMTRKKLNPFKLIDFFKSNIFEIEHIIKTLPLNLSKALYKLEEGKLVIELEHKNLDRMTNRLSLSLILSALLIGSSLIILSNRGTMLFGYSLLGIAGFLISAILGIWLIVSIFRNHDY